ncbi:VCBS domain-containing protein [Rhizobium ruizarguesonis]|uniref:VCBS domain-containing protein n=1 Tax=Rhizobium ruizarguesonis TaxID=2081791 RepID=UPI003F88592E
MDPIRSTITGPATQALNQGDAVSDTLSVSSLDGTASHNIVVAITGANECELRSSSMRRSPTIGRRSRRVRPAAAIRMPPAS